MSELIKSDQRCPCGQSDAFAIYSDGHGYCFSGSCESPYHDSVDGAVDPLVAPAITMSEDVPTPKGRAEALTDRNISEATAKFYGVYTDGSVRQFPLFDAETGDLACVKYKTADKNFWAVPKGVSNTMLFGQQLFREGGKYVTITEGEEDAMAAFEMQGSKYASVSITKGAQGAVKDCQRNFQFLNSFENVVICFDNDKAGQEAAKKVARLFPTKAKIVNLALYKDANEYLKNKATGKFIDAWWNAKAAASNSVLFGDALLDLAFKEKETGVPLIFPKLSEITRGVRMHELWTFGGGTGMGKTELFKALAYGLATEHNAPCGLIFLEESNERTIKCLMGQAIGKRFYLEEVNVTEEEMRLAVEKVILPKKIILNNNRDDFEENWDMIKSRIEYMVLALGCKYIFFDHITAPAMASLEGGTVDAKLHKYMTDLNHLLQAHEFTCFMISHLNKPQGTPHEEGGRVTLGNFYGSGAIKQRSNFVFGIEGNQQAPGDLATLRVLRCLKDRNAGDGAGKTVTLRFNLETGVYEEDEFDEGSILNEGSL